MSRKAHGGHVREDNICLISTGDIDAKSLETISPYEFFDPGTDLTVGGGNMQPHIGFSQKKT